MAKKKDKPNPDTTASEPANDAVSAAPGESQNKTNDTKIEPVAPIKDNSLMAVLGTNEVFVKEHGAALLRIEEETPTTDKLDDIMFALPDELADPISNIMQRMNPNRKGIVSSNTQPDYTELRLFQGTGADPNRPDNSIPGQFYLSSKEVVGPEFFGTVLAIWEGRTMWGDRSDDGAPRMPICTSMDRNRGSNFGDCSTCPNRPWRDNQPQKCANDVVAFMLMKDLKDIVLVRFQRTSEPAGRQLMKLVKRGSAPWMRWFKFTTESRTSQNDKSIRWFVMQVQPVENEKVQKELHPFCDAMCNAAERTFIYPGIAKIYAQAQQALEDAEDDAQPGMDEGDASSYNSMGDAPDDV